MAFTLLTGICIYPIDHFAPIGNYSEDLAEVTKSELLSSGTLSYKVGVQKLYLQP